MQPVNLSTAYQAEGILANIEFIESIIGCIFTKVSKNFKFLSFFLQDAWLLNYVWCS
jgi:hypothetical protein